MINELLSNATVVFVLVGLGVGVSVALITWLVSDALVAVPVEDREFKDPPPLGFRLLWWPIQWSSHYLDPYISDKKKDKLAVTLRQGGLEFSVRPTQYIAGRGVGALVLAGMSYLVLGSFDKDPSGGRFSDHLYLQVCAFGALFGWAYPAIWMRDRMALRRKELLKALPFFLDIVTLCVEAGLNIQGAMSQAVAKGPKGVLRSEFQRVLRDVRAGKQRADAMRAMADRLKEPAVTAFTIAVIQAEMMGMSLGPVLRAQADQRRSERFLRAEKMAMEAPVKMLFPLIAFIFPCTFIVLFFPIVIKFMHSGL
ncbi:type II secretion system F family protein [Aquabacterium sp.]|uniref:type II secretion system F family protein n=1 Tax=Aquabacterium sp. TaxID=1872578 RepID=UPI002488B96A|nr:type II secretion system F family protein [Aquabacterium sp.]MDI1260157.1 type II secretion system F family protein [Aquabacterium sp.]